MPDHHYINNEWKAGQGVPFISRNPATGEVVWNGSAANSAEVSDAVNAAKAAFPSWAMTPLKTRIEYLQKFEDTLKDNLNSLAEAISKDTGKPLWESKGEVNAMINKVSISIRAYSERCPEVSVEHPAGLSITRHKPHGVIAVFGPFNFPGHLPNGHIIPALLAGNSVIWKPSELAPLVGEAVMQCWGKCNLPPGVINMIQGGRDTGRFLMSHSDIDGLFFTGSWETGKILLDQFSKHPEKILALEMGGNNPLVVTKITDPKTAAFITVQSAFLTSGQRCSCARRLIIVKGPNSDAFIQELVRLIQTIKVGPYTDTPEPYMGPVISESAVRHLLAAQDLLKSQGGRTLVEMRLLKIDTGLLSPGLIDVTHVQRRADEEIFGPLLQMIQVPDFNAAIEEANHTAFGLTAGLLSPDADEFNEFYNRINAGIINWNTPLTGASSAAPFGGIGKSGNYRPSAYYAADYCAYPVATIESPVLQLPSTLPPGITI